MTKTWCLPWRNLQPSEGGGVQAQPAEVAPVVAQGTGTQMKGHSLAFLTERAAARTASSCVLVPHRPHQASQKI